MSETMQSEELYERFLDSLDGSRGSLPYPLLESSAENLRPNSERNLPSTLNFKVVKRALKTYGD